MAKLRQIAITEETHRLLELEQAKRIQAGKARPKLKDLVLEAVKTKFKPSKPS